MTGIVAAFALTFVGLFPIVNPLEAAPFFLALTKSLSDAQRNVLARRIAINGFVLLLGSMALGPWVLGKLMSHSLQAFYGLLATAPILALPLLVGGVSGLEFWRVMLIIANTLFF